MFSLAYRPKWSALEKNVFRLLFCYFVGYIFFHFFGSTLEAPLRWFGGWAMNITYDYDVGGFGSGDHTFSYVECLFNACLAVIVTIVWSILDRSRAAYNDLAYWFFILVRAYVIYYMMIYGLMKVFQSQFMTVSLRRLVQPLGTMSPMGLAWTYMGYSPGFQTFTGALELLGAILLVPRRTMLLGALTVFGVMLHVFMMNLSFDIPVKLFSLHLVLMALVIMLPFSSTLANVFLLNRSVDHIKYHAPFSDQVVTFLGYVKYIGFVIIMGLFVFSQLRRHNGFAKTDSRPALYGIWQASTVVTNNEEVPISFNKTDRWRYLIVEYERSALIQDMGDRQQWTRMNYDSTGQSFTMQKRGTGEGQFSYVMPSDDSLYIDGFLGLDTMQVGFRRIAADSFLLKSRGFRWISERPFNR